MRTAGRILSASYATASIQGAPRSFSKVSAPSASAAASAASRASASGYFWSWWNAPTRVVLEEKTPP